MYKTSMSARYESFIRSIVRILAPQKTNTTVYILDDETQNE